MMLNFTGITRSFVKSVFCLSLVSTGVIGFACNAFAQLEGIQGKWNLEQTTGETQLKTSELRHITIIFTGEHELSGFGGCNNYKGYYKEASSNVIQIPKIYNRRPCPPRNSQMQELESKYLQLLQNAQVYNIAGDRLIISGSKGTLIFRKAK